MQAGRRSVLRDKIGENTMMKMMIAFATILAISLGFVGGAAAAKPYERYQYTGDDGSGG